MKFATEFRLQSYLVPVCSRPDKSGYYTFQETGPGTGQLTFNLCTDKWCEVQRHQFDMECAATGTDDRKDCRQIDPDHTLDDTYIVEWTSREARIKVQRKPTPTSRPAPVELGTINCATAQ